MDPMKLGSDILVLLPVLLPMLSAALSVVLWRSRIAQRIIGVAGTFALLAAGIVLLMYIWQAGNATGEFDPVAAVVTMEFSGFVPPFGIVLVGDLLSAIMVVMTGIMGLTVVIYSLATTGEGYEKFGYYPLMQLLHAGVAGAFLTGDIFNLYVWFEVMLVASFALLVLGGKRAQMEGAVKYVTINLVSSMILLTAIVLTYGLVGTLNMAHIAQIFLDNADEPMIMVLASMFIIAFGIKAGSFPMFFWLPASYHTPPVAVSALFAGLLTKVGAYALFRFFTLIFSPELANDGVFDAQFIHGTIMVLGGLTMITGVLGAAAQFEFRRILSIHIISQIGYMLMAIGFLGFTQTTDAIPVEVGQLAIAGGIYYIVHNIIVKTNLFLVSGVVFNKLGSYQLKQLGGIYRRKPFLAALFFIPALSLAGLPPLSGFFAKFSVIRAGLETVQGLLGVGETTALYLVIGVVALALITGLLTLYSMVKIWMYAFWRPAPEDNPNVHKLEEPDDADTWVMYTPIILLLICTVVMGVYSQPFFEVMMGAGEQMINPHYYIEAVGLHDQIYHSIQGEVPAEALEELGEWDADDLEICKE